MIFYSCLESVASFAIDLVLNLLINLSIDELRGTSSFIFVIICFLFFLPCLISEYMYVHYFIYKSQNHLFIFLYASTIIFLYSFLILKSFFLNFEIFLWACLSLLLWVFLTVEDSGFVLVGSWFFL